MEFWTISSYSNSTGETGVTISNDLDEYIWQFEFGTLPYGWVILFHEFVIIAGLPGNIMTILAFSRTPSLRTPTNHLICSLAVADLMTCLATQLRVAFNYTTAGRETIMTDKYACWLSLWAVRSTVVVSLFHLLALTVDRLLAVLWSLQYLVHITETTIQRVVVALWALILVAHSLSILGWSTRNDGHMGCEVASVYGKPARSLYGLTIWGAIIIMAALNGVLAVTAVKKSRIFPGGIACHTHGRHTSTHCKITKMLLMVVGYNILAYCPISAFYLAVAFLYPNDVYPKELRLAGEFFKGLAVTHVVINPCVYAWKDAKFRRAYKKMLAS